jgi:hypothetical protein
MLNERDYPMFMDLREALVISSSKSNSNNNNTYLFCNLLCNYDVIENNTILQAPSYDVKLLCNTSYTDSVFFRCVIYY